MQGASKGRLFFNTFQVFGTYHLFVYSEDSITKLPFGCGKYFCKNHEMLIHFCQYSSLIVLPQVWWHFLFFSYF